MIWRQLSVCAVVIAIVLSGASRVSAATTCTLVVDAGTGATILRAGDRYEAL